MEEDVEGSSVSAFKSLSHEESGIVDIAECRLLRKPRRVVCVTLKMVLGTSETSINS
jgi:hypothetical protein